MNELVLLRRFVDACNGLYLVSQGTTQNFQARVNGTKEHHGPAGEAIPEYDRLLFKLRDKGLSSELVEEAETTLRNWKRQPEPLDREWARDSLAWKRRVANDDGEPEDVCRLYSVSRRQLAGLRGRYREDVS